MRNIELKIHAANWEAVQTVLGCSVHIEEDQEDQWQDGTILVATKTIGDRNWFQEDPDEGFVLFQGPTPAYIIPQGPGGHSAFLGYREQDWPLDTMLEVVSASRRSHLQICRWRTDPEGFWIWMEVEDPTAPYARQFMAAAKVMADHFENKERAQG